MNTEATAPLDGEEELPMKLPDLIDTLDELGDFSIEDEQPQ